MMTRHLHKTVLCLVMLTRFLNSEISYIPFSSSFWEADSLFLGLGLVVNSATDPVAVTWKDNQSDALGELSVVVPGHDDSVRFLFHNMIDSFPSEAGAISLGLLPVGTKLVFQFVVTDTNRIFEPIRNYRLYSGQNRIGIDQFISEREGLADYRWAVAGRVNDSTCEMSFAGVSKGDFRQIRFHVTNVYREELEKYRPEAPVATPTGEEFSKSVSVALESHTVGNPRIYYTLDSSDPDSTSSPYESAITIESTATLKAIAVMPGDTQWVESEITEETYTLVSTNVRRNAICIQSNSPFVMQEIYNIKGQKIPIARDNGFHHTSSVGAYVLISDQNGQREIIKRILHR